MTSTLGTTSATAGTVRSNPVTGLGGITIDCVTVCPRTSTFITVLSGSGGACGSGAKGATPDPLVAGPGAAVGGTKVIVPSRFTIPCTTNGAAAANWVPCAGCPEKVCAKSTDWNVA